MTNSTPATVGDVELPQRGPERLLPRRAARAFWLVLAPLASAALTLRYLVPDRSEIGPGPWGALARLGESYPLPLAIGLFFLFALLIRHFDDVLPLGHHLRPAATAEALPAAQEPSAQKLISLLSVVVLAAAAALALRTSVGQAYRVTSGSMLPTIVPSDHVLVNKLAYGLRLPGARVAWGARPPARGDVVAFRASAVGEHGSEDQLVKRVVGLPGDWIRMRAGVVEINGWDVPMCEVGKYVHLGPDAPVSGRLFLEFLDDRAHLTLHTTEGGRRFDGYLVKPGEVFVVGDNRNMSLDSRLWRRGNNGPAGAGVPFSAIEGQAARVLSWDRNGHLAWNHLLRKPDLEAYLPGMDTHAIEAKIASCLQNWPQQTRPPQAAAPR